MSFLDAPSYPRPAIDAKLGVIRSPALDAGDPAAVGIARLELDGDADVFSHAASNWIGEVGPMARLRVSRTEPDNRGGKDLLICPYRFGMAIEYDGVVECWVQEWSIHNNSQSSGVNKPAILWVGNHEDTGGLYMSAHELGDPPVRFCELVSQRFTGQPAGYMRFVVRDPQQDYFSFQVGPQGAESEHVRIDDNGVRAANVRTDTLSGVTASDVTLNARLKWQAGQTRLAVGANDANTADALPATPAVYLEVRDPAGEVLLVPAFKAAA